DLMPLGNRVALLHHLGQTRDGKSHVGADRLRLWIERLNRTSGEVTDLPRITPAGQDDQFPFVFLAQSARGGEDFINQSRRAVHLDEERGPLLQAKPLKAVQSSHGA